MSISRTRIIACLIGAGLTAFASLGTGCIGYAEDVCEQGERCECDGIGACNLDCEGGNCDFICKGTGACEFACPDGGCIAYCKGQGDCTMSCSGGDCTMYCLGTGSCGITDCGPSCELDCRTVGKCTNE